MVQEDKPATLTSMGCQSEALHQGVAVIVLVIRGEQVGSSSRHGASGGPALSTICQLSEQANHA